MKIGRKIELLFVCLAIIAASCRSSEVVVTAARPWDSLYTAASKMYFWNTNLDPPDKFDFGKYSTPETILNSFRERSTGRVDRWSFAVKESMWSDMEHGQTEDFGIGLRFFGDEDLRIAYVIKNSPAAAAALKRSDRILEINGVKCVRPNIEKMTEMLAVEPILKMLIDDGTLDPRTVDLRRSSFEIDPVLHSEILRTTHGDYGYVNLLTFSSGASEALLKIFEEFSEAKVNRLVVDLRYNGGGLLGVMEELGNYIAPGNSLNQVMYSTKHNSLYRDFDTKTFFHEVNFGLNSAEVTFIVSENTASASEVLIHALRPYMKVRLIGGKTHGKLMGMYPLPVQGYVVVPVSFAILNSLGQHDNFLGLMPDIEMADDVKTQWGRNESLIATAIAETINMRISNAPTTLFDKMIHEPKHLLRGNVGRRIN